MTVAFQTARTVVADLEAERYEVSLTNSKGETTSGSGEQTVVFDDLEDGVWTISAVALSSNDSVVASGSTSVDLTGGPTSVVVPLATTQDGFGTFSFTFTAPKTLGITSVRADLLDQGTSLGEITLGDSALPEDPENPDRFLATVTNQDFSEASIPSGAYLLLLTFLGANDLVLGSHAEAINVWDNVESNAWLDPEGNLLGRRDFGAGEFASSSTLPADLEVQGIESAVPFSPSTFEYVVHATNSAFSVVGTEGAPGQRLQYSIEGVPWTDLRWGESLTVDFWTSTRVVLRVTAPDRSTFVDYALVDPYTVARMPYGPDYIPVALAGDDDGNLFVVDASMGNIWKVGTEAPALYFESDPNEGSESLSDPVGIVRDPSGNLYVSERNNAVVKRIDPQLNVTTLEIPDLVDPTALALSSDYLFVTSGGPSSDDKGSIVAYRFSDGQSTSIPLGARIPQGLAVDETRDRLYIACDDGKIWTFDLAGESLTPFWAESGSNPMALTLDPDGNLYACLFSAHRLEKITPQGVAKTIVGDGIAGVVDGDGTQARVSKPHQVVRSPQGVFSFLEYGEPSIRTVR